MLCGGGDEEIDDASRRDALLARKAAWLRRRLAALLPAVDARVAFGWSGFFGTSTRGLPTIGAVSGLRNAYAVLGYGGNGITFSMLAAQLLRNLITGEGDPDAELLAFDRKR